MPFSQIHSPFANPVELVVDHMDTVETCRDLLGAIEEFLGSPGGKLFLKIVADCIDEQSLVLREAAGRLSVAGQTDVATMANGRLDILSWLLSPGLGCQEAVTERISELRKL